MKIDCPHCGVHGSIDNSLLERKLRCPKCSKVFLVTEDILPEMDDTGMLSQEILYDDEPQGPESEEQGIELDDEAGNLQACSACGQSFAPELLEEVDLKLYCAQCRPELEEEIPDLLEEDGDDELLAIMDEEAPDEESEEVSPEEDDDLLDLMADESDDDEPESNPEDELEDDLEAEEESAELEKCSGCGELLHPDFLETKGSERFCALCAPEKDVEKEDEIDLELQEVEEVDLQDEDESNEIEDVSSDQKLMVDDVVDETDEVAEEIEVTEEVVEEDEDQDSYPKELCSVCGEEFHRDFMQEIDSKLYCGVCQPEVIDEESTDNEAVLAGVGAVAAAGAVMATGDDEETDAEAAVTGADFTVGELIKESWQKTKGVKGAVWGAVITMCVVLSAISYGVIVGFQDFYKGSDPMMTMGVNTAVQLVANWLSMIMTGGIMLIGVRHVLQQRVSWKMVFAGFSKTFSITVALILQTILIVIGFLLLVIPGIYLSVGYGLALPLILDKGMGPWEALEASRKAIHKKWWTVFGLYLVMMLIYVVSIIPLGLGLIWTVPMFFVLIGVLYVRLFGSDEIPEEDLEEESGDELEEEVEEDPTEEIDESEEIKEDLEEISEEIESKK